MKYPDDFINKIICGDCLEVMKEMPDRCVDLCLTDFPYANNTDYGMYEDTKENLRKLIRDGVPEILRISKIAFIACGIGNMFSYPEPDWVLSWHWHHTNSGSSWWGFNTWQPILAYGKDPYLANRLGRRQDSTGEKQIDRHIKHPCPKPLAVWEWLLLRGSINKDDIILDPFLGSGTTVEACKLTHRNFIGIEINPDYCKIAEGRLAQGVL